MNLSKILLITQREYITRVRKRSFIIMTILGPLLIALFYGIIIYFAIHSGIGSKQKTVAVHDGSGFFKNNLLSNQSIKYIESPDEIDAAKLLLKEEDIDALLLIPKTENEFSLKEVELITKTQPGISTIQHIENSLEDILNDIKLKKLDIDKSLIEKAKTSISIKTVKVTDKGSEEGSSAATSVAGFAGAMLIYMFIFLYGVQVMRGVMEEKTNRIVEVIISSVRPFELMMGKIIGIALVGLTQFVIWIGLTILTYTVTTALLIDTGKINVQEIKKAAIESRMNSPIQQQNQFEGSNENFNVTDINKAVETLNFPLIISMFLFFFITGYLFYGALFAAVGAAVDTETDTQQFMLPLTLPLIFGFVIAQTSVLNNPDGTLATVLSLIPLTAPVVMMVRIPFFDHFNIEIVLSMLFMILGFLATVKLSAKIYRTGILMYGKKITYKELGKWLFYK